MSHIGTLLIKQNAKAIVFEMLRSFPIESLVLDNLQLSSVKVKETSTNRLKIGFITELGNSWSTLRVALSHLLVYIWGAGVGVCLQHAATCERH